MWNVQRRTTKIIKELENKPSLERLNEMGFFFLLVEMQLIVISIKCSVIKQIKVASYSTVSVRMEQEKMCFCSSHEGFFRCGEWFSYWIVAPWLQ